MEQYGDDDHREDAPHFSKVLVKLKLRIWFIGYESYESKLRQGEELLNDNKGIITDIKNQNYELDNKIKEGFKSSHMTQSVFCNMGRLELNPF